MAVVALLPASLVAQTSGGSGPPEVRAALIQPAVAPRLDGYLSEDVWRQATPITEFTQQEPVEGGVPSESTEIYILYDEDNLYIGAILYDEDPGGILGYQRRRDVGLGTDDRFMWILDTFGDGRTGYFFEINPAGLMGDGLMGGGGGGGGINKRWDGIWEVQVAQGDFGWSAEIRIPFSTLNFDPNVDSWGINFQRTIRRRNEEILWSGYRRNQGLFRPANAGRLSGLEGVSQGLGLEVKPYSVGSWTGETAASGRGESDVKAGLDVSYSITPSLRAAVSLNTDFAEVEVDQRRVNLTRFPISFPEQREFFLEGSGVFGFAPTQGIQPFFSRRIGLQAGQEIPIRVGARLGGQVGRNEVGFFQVRTGSSPTTPAEDFTVARVKRSLFRQSSVGLVYTRRAEAFGTDWRPDGWIALPDRHTVATDFDLFTGSFLGDKNFQVAGFAAMHTDPVPQGGSSLGDRSAAGIRVNFPNDLWQIHSSLRQFGDAFDPATGFQARNGFRRLQPSITYAPRPAWLPGVRQLEFTFYYEYLTSLSNELLTRSVNLTPLDLNFESGDGLELQYNSSFERLERDFTISPGVVVTRGNYRTAQWVLSGRTTGRRKVSANGRVDHGSFWSGDRTQWQGGVTGRLFPGWTFGVEGERNDVRLPQGEFRVNLGRVEAAWDLSPMASITSSVQYDDQSRLLGLFARARWIVRPGSDIFLVYTHNWQNQEAYLFENRDLVSISRGAAAKVNYSYRF